MKKILFLLLTLSMVLSFAALRKVNADETSVSTSDWMPQRYVLSGYEIPTVMTYTDKTVTFSGSLNAGIATTGFNYLKPVDLNNFSIDMDLDIPDIDKLTWLCFSFLDKNLTMDAENSVAPVAEPFNAMSGKGGYNNNEQTGLVLQVYTQSLLTDNIMGFDYVSKNLDFATGDRTTSGWRGYTNNSFINSVKLDEEYNGKFKLEIHSDEEDGLVFNVNNGAWKYQDEAGDYVQTRDNLCYDNSKGLRTYFNDKECYFACVLMYKDEVHRNVNLTVNAINGMNPSDNQAPSYLGSKEIESGNVKATIPANALGIFGVYPNAIDGLKVINYDEEDGDYESVQNRANSLKATVIDYFRVVPQIGKNNVVLANPMTVEYTLPTGYDQYKAYFINDDDETQAFPQSYVSIADNKMQLKVDNDIINKIVIYGLNNAETPTDNPTEETPSNPADNNSTAKKGCNGSFAMIGTLSLAIVSMGAIILKKKRDE